MAISQLKQIYLIVEICRSVEYHYLNSMAIASLEVDDLVLSFIPSLTCEDNMLNHIGIYYS